MSRKKESAPLLSWRKGKFRRKVDSYHKESYYLRECEVI